MLARSPEARSSEAPYEELLMKELLVKTGGGSGPPGFFSRAPGAPGGGSGAGQTIRMTPMLELRTARVSSQVLLQGRA